MKPRHQVSRAAIELIKRFEGYRRTAARLPNGGWTIGYGHTVSAREGAQVSEADAEALLLWDLMAVAKEVDDQTFAALTQNQFDALCAFAFNVGLDEFRASEVLRRINEGALLQAACAMEMWRRADFQGSPIVIDALVRRRAAEKALFLTPQDGVWPVAPTALLKPRLDEAAAPLVPAEEPTAVQAPLDGEAAVVLPLAEAEPAPGELPAAESPVMAAAEAVTARLETLFAAEPGPAEEDPAAAEPAPDLEPVEDQGEPAIEVEAPPPDEAGFVLESEPEPAQAERADAPLSLDPREPEAAQEPDLFDPPAVANDLTPETPEPLPEVTDPGSEPRPDRVVIDDTAPFEFVPVEVQTLPTRQGGGLFSLVLLAIVGLAFFAGGLFWAVNAQPNGEGGFLTPKVVGALACAAGVGLFAIAVYLLLQRLGEAAERLENDRN